jgi:hypothetical protein
LALDVNNLGDTGLNDLAAGALNHQTLVVLSLG